MKKSLLVFVSSLAVCLLLTSSASALTRMVVAEMFANSG
jgi:hypothetical protein